MDKFERLVPSAPLSGVAAAEVDALEQVFGPFPDGYRRFITHFGRGVLGGLVRIFPPQTMLTGERSVTEWRKRIDEYWFWDESSDVLSKEHALACVNIADTVGGDELIFHPTEPDRLFVLAHDFDIAHVASTTGLEAAVEWFFTSGALDEPFEDDRFEPY